jgi:hypothetical protein
LGTAGKGRRAQEWCRRVAADTLGVVEQCPEEKFAAIEGYVPGQLDPGKTHIGSTDNIEPCELFSGITQRAFRVGGQTKSENIDRAWAGRQFEAAQAGLVELDERASRKIDRPDMRRLWSALQANASIVVPPRPSVIAVETLVSSGQGAAHQITGLPAWQGMRWTRAGLRRRAKSKAAHSVARMSVEITAQSGKSIGLRGYPNQADIPINK